MGVVCGGAAAAAALSYVRPPLSCAACDIMECSFFTDVGRRVNPAGRERSWERRSLTEAKQDLLQIDLNLSLDIGREKFSDTFSIILSLFSGDLIGGSGSFLDRFRRLLAQSRCPLLINVVRVPIEPAPPPPPPQSRAGVTAKTAINKAGMAEAPRFMFPLSVWLG